MKKIYVTILVFICCYFYIQSVQKEQNCEENESELKVLETETKEVSKDEMEMAIQRVAYKIQEMEQDFNIVNREERIQNEKFDCIMMKRMAFEWRDAVIDVEGYFEVDKESGMM